MNLILRNFLYVTATFIFSLGAFAQPPKIDPAPAIGELYIAKDDGTGNAGEASIDFVTTDVPLYCVVLLNVTGKVTVKMNLIAVSVPGVRAETKVVTTTFTTRENQNRVNFSGHPDGKWAAGKYRADIYINNEFAEKLDFEIRRTIPPVKAVSDFQPKPIQNSIPPAKKQNR
ncbi:MAG: hypothetical protein ACR2M8_00785 [Pyrinomonadaceae bacterium]|nr:hypothetical protein [Blastocatellia bacterium]MDQ3219260.1 hypothetical protein [Acidobacteriota bacterium]